VRIVNDGCRRSERAVCLNLHGVKSGDILNTFSYTCPFSVCVAQSGLRAVSLDLSKKYLEWGKMNFQLNEINPDEHDFIYGDVFDWMRRFRNRGRTFSGVILDPPTFSKAPKSKKKFQAEKDYPDLLNLALDIIEPGGVILACNNTVGWIPLDFEKKIHQTLKRRGVVSSQICFTQQPPEFPVSLSSPQHLKSAWIKVADAGKA
jgi:23S rRNA (cytosine1962-C5)-methyltransferase